MALAFLRRQQWWLKYFLGLVVVSFVILYIPAFMESDAGSPSEVLAQVGATQITVGEFRRTYFRERQRLEQAYQGRLDPGMIEQLRLKEQTLDLLIEEKLVLLEAQRFGLAVSDDELARHLTTSPDLQQNGRFIGAAELRRLLDLRGMTLEEFEESRRGELLAQKLAALLTDGIVVTAPEAEGEFRRRSEQVRAEYVLVDSKRFEAETIVSEDEARARFEAKKEAYRIPEKRAVSFLRVDTLAFQARVSVKDHEIEAYYREHQDEFREDEQACARHILIKVKGGEGQEGHGEEEARKLAQSILDQLRRGADFSEVAKKSSEDKGSASGGGDLGCFSPGQMKPEFDEAAFSLPVGQTSELVKTDFGYHIVQVTSRREESTKPLAQLKEGLRGRLTNQLVQNLVEQKAEEVALALRRGRSLEEAASDHQLSVQKSRPFARGENVPGLESALLVSRAFEMKRGEIEESPFALPRGYAFIALVEEQPSRLPELKEVQDRLKADLLEEKALGKALSRAREVKGAAAKSGLEKAAGTLGLVRKETPSLLARGQALGDLGASIALDEAAFSLPEGALSEPIRVSAGYAVIRILEKKPFDPVAFDSERAALMVSLRQERRRQFFRAYMSQLRQRYPVERRLAALERALG